MLPRILCDDNTMNPDDALAATIDRIQAAFAKSGVQHDSTLHVGSQMLEAGFTNVQVVQKKVPVGPWARNRTMRLVGRLMVLSCEALITSLDQLFDKLAMSEGERRQVVAETMASLNDKRPHRYVMYYFWFAQKPVTREE